MLGLEDSGICSSRGCRPGSRPARPARPRFRDDLAVGFMSMDSLLFIATWAGPGNQQGIAAHRKRPDSLSCQYCKVMHRPERANGNALARPAYSAAMRMLRPGSRLSRPSPCPRGLDHGEIRCIQPFDAAKLARFRRSSVVPSHSTRADVDAVRFRNTPAPGGLRHRERAAYQHGAIIAADEPAFSRIQIQIQRAAFLQKER